MNIYYNVNFRKKKSEFVVYELSVAIARLDFSLECMKQNLKVHFFFFFSKT